MNSENIFKLLLIVLLIANNHDADCECRDGDSFEGLSNVILLALLLGFLGNQDSLSSTATTTSSTNTTF